MAVGVAALKIILQAITHNGKELVLTLMLLTIIVYIYTVIAFNFFRQFYVSGEDEEESKMCHDMLTVSNKKIEVKAILSDPFWVRQAQREVVKIKKILIFPTGLQVHLEDMFWVYKLFAEILSWAEQSGTQFFRRSNLLVVSSSCAALFFQHFDIWWWSLNILNDFKAISKTGFFRFGEINKSWFWVLSKKIFN